ncbi:MAG: cache domain-containing protein, partial [Pseudomonas sp.]
MSKIPSLSKTGSAATRLMLGTALIALLCFGLTAAISYWRSADALLAASRGNMENLAKLESQRIASEMDQALSAGQAIASNFLAQRGAGGLDRGIASEIVHRELQAHPQWVGMGTLWEPDAFDSRDSAFIHAEGHDGTGRFMSYWAWQDGTPVREPLRDYEKPGDGDWYLLARKQHTPLLVEPYNYLIGGKNVLMTTLTTPVLQDGTFLGVVTVDFALASLQQRIAAMRPMGEGHVSLISPAGTVLAERDPQQVGKTLDDAATRSMLAAIGKGEVYTDQLQAGGIDEVRAFVPLKVGNAPQVFALGVSVPRSLLMAQARSMLWTTILAGLFSALVLSGALYLLVRRQVLKPLAEAVQVSSAVAAGRLDSQIRYTRNDELGQLLAAMQRMQQQLRAVMQAQTEMAQRHDAGQISYRMDESRFPGEFGAMVRDTNALVGSHVAVKLNLVKLMGEYAIGDLSRDLEQYPGEKAIFTVAMVSVRM